MPYGAKKFGFAFVSMCMASKNPNTPNLTSSLTTPLHEAVYQVWDLPCTSVNEIQDRGLNFAVICKNKNGC